jgi:hypothetical protein
MRDIFNDYYGDSYKWYVGVVKELHDADRVKVRIFGIHHMEDKTNVSDGDLPLALVMLPVTDHGGGHSLAVGDWVTGFFSDGDDCQQPIVIGKLKGGIGSSDNSKGSTGAAFPGQDGNANDKGGDSTPTATPSNLKGNTNAQKAYNFFRERIEASGKSGGDKHVQAAALTAQGISESNMNPRASVMDTNGWPSKGITQWNRERLWKIERTYGDPSSQGDKNLRPLNSTLEQQLAFWWDEMQTTETKAFNRLMAARDKLEATDAMIAFGRPKDGWKIGPGNVGYVDRNSASFQQRLKGVMNAVAQFKYDPRGDK